MNISAFFLPFLLCVIAAIFFFSKKDLWQIFVRGCKEGAVLTYDLLPTLILLIVGVRMFCASGGMDALCALLKPICAPLNIPKEILPVALMRPISGSGATAVLAELFALHGADSFPALCACIFMGATDTVIYTLSFYFSVTKRKKAGACLPISFLVMIFSLIFSCFIARIFYKFW